MFWNASSQKEISQEHLEGGLGGGGKQKKAQVTITDWWQTEDNSGWCGCTFGVEIMYLARQVRVTVSKSGLCCCDHVKSCEC